MRFEKDETKISDRPLCEVAQWPNCGRWPESCPDLTMTAMVPSVRQGEKERRKHIRDEGNEGPMKRKNQTKKKN